MPPDDDDHHARQDDRQVAGYEAASEAACVAGVTRVVLRPAAGSPYALVVALAVPLELIAGILARPARGVRLRP
ncbi:hypothetical protein [Streptomyces sp. NRRL F-5126]|uniref:hypothetical protein n=1 Tax=Streptomyces sp. NRRL F-5126 TaxID=1463857 RepID=UPI0004C630B5|nr:hypothetical protein [Streptomyces sp. NRRL F-5126]